MAAGRHEDTYEHLHPLFQDLADCKDGAEREALREKLITGHLPVAQHIARRFSRPGQSIEDLTQVATIGLINAVDRFDPSMGKDFLSFAVPTIMGVVRKHFRDHTWAVHVPRRLKELHLRIGAASAELFQLTGHSPTPSELAEHLGVSVEEVHDGIEATNAQHTVSLDAPTMTDGSDTPFSDLLGDDDPALANIDYYRSLRPLIAELDERERLILRLRFGSNLTQSEIGQRVGLSQMHVSRILSQTIRGLREGLEIPP